VGGLRLYVLKKPGIKIISPDPLSTGSRDVLLLKSKLEISRVIHIFCLSFEKQCPTKGSIDAFVESQEISFFVIPAEAGIQEHLGFLDSGFRRGDGSNDFLRSHKR
jgi:hypothetical protein